MITTATLVILAQLATIPVNMQTSIDTALATQDKFIIKAVLTQALEENPQHREEIKRYTYEQAAVTNFIPQEAAKYR